jgi:tRNA (guanine-N7-)-methyltransferase
METQEIRTFGRRHGKRLSARQQMLIDNLLPAVLPKNNEKAGKNFILEIGFGAGEHLRELTVANPDSIIVGAEPFVNGVASLLSAIANDAGDSVRPEYKNIRIWADDVRRILKPDSPDFIDATFSEIYILHPDPWPKARHEKRRLLNSDFLTLLSARLDTSGRIIIGTDHWGYFDWITNQVKGTDLKVMTTETRVIETRYQQKNKAETSAPKYLVLSN